MPLSDRRALELVARKVVLCALFSPALVGDLFKLAAEPKGLCEIRVWLEQPWFSYLVDQDDARDAEVWKLQADMGGE